MNRLPPGLYAYRTLTRALRPAADLWLSRRAESGKEDAARLPERHGKPSQIRPDGALIWLHGASVGESKLLLQLAAALQPLHPEASFLITSGTRTSAAEVARNAPADMIHQFAPLDTPRYATRFFRAWRPDLGIFAESELWPNLILEAEAKGVPLALVNARLNADSLARWSKRAPKSARRLLGAFDWIGPADEATAAGLSDLLERDVPLVGNMKFDAPAPPVDDAALANLRAALGERPVWLASSTHAGEEALVLDAHAALTGRLANPLLILAPRHPERADALSEEIRARGFKLARRSRGEAPGREVNVYLADTLGELGLLYRAAPVSLIAGSLLPEFGGHNPVEAVQCGSALISGAHTASFGALYDQLESAGGLLCVQDSEALTEAVAALLENGPARRRQQAAAEDVLEASRGALKRTLEALAPLLPERQA